MTKYELRPHIERLEDGHQVVLKSLFKNSPGGEPIRKPACIATFKSGLPYRRFNPNLKAKYEEHEPKLVTSSGEEIALSVVGPDYYRRSEFIDSDGHTREIAWTLPLPELDEDQILKFVAALRGDDRSFLERSSPNDHEPNVFLRVDDIGETFAMCRMISWADETIEEHERAVQEVGEDGSPDFRDHAFHYIDMDEFAGNVNRLGDFAVSAYELKICLEDLPKEVSPKALISADTVCCEIKSGEVITRVSGARIAGDLEKAALDIWFPQRPETRGDDVFNGFYGSSDRVPMQTIQYHLKEVARAESALIPSEALVLVFPPEEGKTSYFPATVILGTQGATFFEGDGTEQDYMESIAPEEGGLWVLEKASYWSSRDSYSGEYDAGLDGEFRPADEADLKRFGFSKESLNDEAEEHYECGDGYLSAFEDGSFAEKMMEVARNAQEEWARKKSESSTMSASMGTMS